MYNLRDTCSEISMMRPMEQVLFSSFQADIIVTASKAGRPIGRPWITIAFCKATKMIVGSHVDFELPSAGTLTKCLAHAILPKRLDGLGLLNDWPCEGVPQTIVGKDESPFRSPSLQKAVSDLGCKLLYDLSSKDEGAVALERYFGKTNTAFRTTTEARTYSFPRQAQDISKPISRIDLIEFERDLSRWIVDDYHVTINAELGCTPLEAWRAQGGSLRSPPYDHDAVLALRSWRLQKRITKLGIGIKGQVYWHRDLIALRESYGPAQRYDVRFDPQNPSSVTLRKPDEEWITLQNVREVPSLSPSMDSLNIPRTAAAAGHVRNAGGIQ